MPLSDRRRISVEASSRDADAAHQVHDGALAWFAEHSSTLQAPLASEVWVFDPSLSMVLLVNHPWRNWVPPGGKVEDGETPRQAAIRETLEETGLSVVLHDEPAAVAVRSFHPRWPATLALSYSAIAGLHEALDPENDQPASWWPLQKVWPSSFPDDRDRMINLVRLLRATG